MQGSWAYLGCIVQTLATLPTSYIIGSTDSHTASSDGAEHLMAADPVIAAVDQELAMIIEHFRSPVLCKAGQALLLCLKAQQQPQIDAALCTGSHYMQGGFPIQQAGS